MLHCCPPVVILTTNMPAFDLPVLLWGLHSFTAPLTFFSSIDMKHPKRPDLLNNNSPPPKSQEQQQEEDEEEKRMSQGHRAKRERRQSSSSPTVCQVCNIQLNSSAQAQIHYRGKTHQRKLRRLAKAVSTGRDALVLCPPFFSYMCLFIVDYWFCSQLSSSLKL